ncbi:MAG TPA: hypothetical protein DCR14_08090 [Acidimicrobiaceae bacterium]|nr:hypothetical protein [Acidimicrobiaceae bacterium]
MKRNTLFGGFSLLVAGAAIGAGAVASGNAMAGSDAPPSDEGTVEVITGVASIDGSSDAFSCTFENVELADIFEVSELPMPADIDAIDGIDGIDGGGVAVAVGVDEVFEVSLDSLPEGVEMGETGYVGVPIEIDADSLPVIEGVEMIDPADVREGTAEECAGVLAGGLPTDEPTEAP